MFDQLKGMGSIAGLLKDLPKVKARMEEVKTRLAEVRVEAETGGGAVRAVSDGQLHLIALEIDPSLMAGLVDAGADEDRALAQELIVGAVNAAMVKAREAAEQEVQQAAGELGIPLPAGGLGGLIG